MSLQEGDRVMLTRDETFALTKGSKGTVISDQWLGNYEIKFDNGDTRVVNEDYLTKL